MKVIYHSRHLYFSGNLLTIIIYTRDVQRSYVLDKAVMVKLMAEWHEQKTKVQH